MKRSAVASALLGTIALAAAGGAARAWGPADEGWLAEAQTQPSVLSEPGETSGSLGSAADASRVAEPEDPAGLPHLDDLQGLGGPTDLPQEGAGVAGVGELPDLDPGPLEILSPGVASQQSDLIPYVACASGSVFGVSCSRSFSSPPPTGAEYSSITTWTVNSVLPAIQSVVAEALDCDADPDVQDLCPAFPALASVGPPDVPRVSNRHVTHAIPGIVFIGLLIVAAPILIVRFFAGFARVKATLDARRARKQTLAHLPWLLEHERDILGHLLHRGQKSFVGNVDGGAATTLLDKGLIVRSIRDSPNSYFNLEKVEFSVPDPVWDALVNHLPAFPVPVADQDGGASNEPWRR